MNHRLLLLTVVLFSGLLLVATVPTVTYSTDSSHTGPQLNASTENETPATSPDPVDVAEENVTVALEKRGVPGQGVNGSPIPFDVVVYNATDGINAFNITVEINELMTDLNASVADYEISNSPLFDNTRKVRNDTRIHLAVALGENTHPPGEKIPVARVGIRPTEPGELAAEPIAAGVSNSANDTSYSETFVEAGTQTIVEGPDPLPGFDERPQDLTGDLLLEDITGDGAVDSGDALALFFQRDAIDDDEAKFFSFGEDPEEIDTVDSGNALTLFFERDIRNAGEIP